MSITIHIHHGSILDVRADAIVNPANGFLNHAGGLAGVIERAARADYQPVHSLVDGRYPPVAKLKADRRAADEAVARWDNDHRNAPLIPVGGAHMTSAGRLPFAAVIHAVGPVWGGGELYEDELLSEAVRNAVDAAWGAGFRSLAMPAISCGIFGFPVKRAASIILSAIQWQNWGYDVPLDVTVALTDTSHVEAFQRAAARDGRGAGIPVDFTSAD